MSASGWPSEKQVEHKSKACVDLRLDLRVRLARALLQLFSASHTCKTFEGCYQTQLASLYLSSRFLQWLLFEIRKREGIAATNLIGVQSLKDEVTAGGVRIVNILWNI